VGYADADADGYAACEECDDGNADVNPSADEYCNDRDDDCDAAIDEDALDPSTWYCDADGDGFGDAACTTSACDLPAGYSELPTDCDDGEIGTYPGAPEVVADGIDQDCDGGDACTSDLDADGYTDGSTVASADLDCEDPGEAGASTPTGDCDDTDAATNPAAIEICDGDDDDCDGEVDEVSIYSPTWYRDADSDGYGDAGDSVEACEAPGGYVADGSDCDDEDASANPAGTEACGGGDEDCDGAVDEAGASGEATWYADGDGDGYGDSEVAVTACEAPAESVAAGGDCDDADDLVHPGATEVCGNAVDDDCDGGAGRCTFEGNVAAVDAEAVLSEETGGDDLIAVASAGDVDGDGYPEVIVAASSEDTAAVNAGAVYLAWGPLSGSLSLGDDAVTKLTGESSAGGTLTAVAGVGDVNSDGYADFMAGAYGSASAYLVYGPAVTNGSLADADVVFSGAPFVGSSVAGGADLDGDGVDDLSIGTGAATSMDYLFFGGTATAWGDVADADATVQCGTCTGHAQYLGGDANDDGLDDAVIGAYQGDGQDGQACLILGAATLTGALEADATLYGAGQEYAAHSVAILDDVTGDGGADLLIGAGRGSQNAYIVDGRVSGTVELATDSSARISVIGYQACPAGDVDDDGNADIVGMGYLFLGPVTASLTTSDANATLAGGGAYPSCGAGDLDGDGVDDILFRSGGVYVVSGRPGL
jgi:hypothetical protein